MYMYMTIYIHQQSIINTKIISSKEIYMGRSRIIQAHDDKPYKTLKNFNVVLVFMQRSVAQKKLKFAKKYNFL